MKRPLTCVIAAFEWSRVPADAPCAAKSTPPSPATQYPDPSFVTTAVGMELTAQFVSAVVVSTLPSKDTRATTRRQPAVATVEPGGQPRQPSTRKRPSVDRERPPMKVGPPPMYIVHG
jgi:hypothetical protein